MEILLYISHGISEWWRAHFIEAPWSNLLSSAIYFHDFESYLFDRELFYEKTLFLSGLVNKANVAKWSVVERAVQANKHGKGSSGLLKTRLSVTRNAPLLVPQISRHETVISLDMILEQL